MTAAAPPRPARKGARAAPSPRAPEALIEEARRRARRRRLKFAAGLLLLAVLAMFIYIAGFGVVGSREPAAAPARPVGSHRLEFGLKGFGTPLVTSDGSGACPAGRTEIQIVSASGAPLGSAEVCVLTIRKEAAPDGQLRRIVQTVLETDSLPGGAIRSRQTQTFAFAPDQRDSIATRATFSGEVVGGTGRYENARGTVTGGGPGVDGQADWFVTIELDAAVPVR